MEVEKKLAGDHVSVPKSGLTKFECGGWKKCPDNEYAVDREFPNSRSNRTGSFFPFLSPPAPSPFLGRLHAPPPLHFFPGRGLPPLPARPRAWPPSASRALHLLPPSGGRRPVDPRWIRGGAARPGGAAAAEWCGGSATRWGGGAAAPNLRRSGTPGRGGGRLEARRDRRREARRGCRISGGAAGSAAERRPRADPRRRRRRRRRVVFFYNLNKKFFYLKFF